jgi:hypothetical protein
MAEAGDHYRSFQSVEIEDQTSSTSVREQNRILPVSQKLKVNF